MNKEQRIKRSSKYLAEEQSLELGYKVVKGHYDGNIYIIDKAEVVEATKETE